MDNRNRRDRNRGYNSNQNDPYRSSPDYYGSRQAEQFEDSNGYAQDDRWADDGRYSQQNDRSGWGGSYDDDYGRQSARRGGRGRDDRMAAETLAARNERFGPARYDNGMGYYTSESQGGRDFSAPSRLGGYGDYGAGRGGQSAYGNGRGADRDGYTTARHSDSPRQRDWWDRTTDEIASWFGDDDATRRREMDHRGRGPSDYTRSDDRIREDVNDRLTEDWAVDASKVRVKVEKAEVTLDGTVPTRLQKRRAEDCAEDVSGVRHVQNNLRIGEDNRAATGDYAGNQTTPSRESTAKTV